MKLERMAIRNFRQYYGTQRLTFSVDKKRNVTVINGNNGAGKTSLFLALNWGLYGVFPKDVGDMVNKQAMADSAIGGQVEVQVEIGVVDQGEHYLLSRSVAFVKDADLSWHMKSEPILFMNQVSASGSAKVVINPARQVETWLPESVRTYFFFDGEKIEQFAKVDHEDEVREAVRKIVKIELLERTRTHLDMIARDYAKELKTVATGQLKDLAQEHEQLTQEKDEAQRQYDSKQKELSACKRLLQEVDARLSEVKEIRQWVEIRSRHEAEKERYEQKKQQTWDDLRSVVSQGHVLMSEQLAAQAVAVLDEKRRKGEIPLGFREQFLQDLLDKQVCICGGGLEPGSEGRKLVERLLSTAMPNELEDQVLQAAGMLKSVALLSSYTRRRIVDLRKDISVLEQQIEGLDSQIQEVSLHLKEHSEVEEVAPLESKRNQYRDQQGDLQIDVLSLRLKIDDLTTKVASVNDRMNKVQGLEKRAREIQARYLLAKESAEAIEGILAAFASDARASIGAEARKVFDELIWKDSQFRSVDLSDDYRLEVIDRWGTPARPELSAGERQVLSLSFITAMARVAGEEAPIVMDTPFGRLFSVHREAITERLPELTPQLILFVQDQELTGEARRKLEGRIGFEYFLDFSQSTGCTSIQTE